MLRTEEQGLRTEPGPEDSVLSPPHSSLKDLHRRFGNALEARGDLEEALGHYASAGATVELAQALRRHARPLLQSPRRDVVRRWLEQLPAAVRENDSDLLYMWGYSQIVYNPDQAVIAIEQASDRYHQAGQYERELRALADLTALLYLRGRPPNFIANCVRAVRAANLARDPWSRGAALVCVTAMLDFKGRYLAALRVARQVAALPLSPAWQWLKTMIVASINNLLGLPADALSAIDETLQLPQMDHDDRLRQNLLRLRAFAMFLQGQIGESTTLALDAHRYLGDYYHDGSASLSARQLAFLLVLQGRVDEASTYVAQARAAFHDTGALAPLSSLQAIELYGMLQRGQGAKACAAVGAVLHRLDEAEGQERDLRLRLLLAIVLGEGGQVARALTLTQEIAGQMQRQGYRLFLACAQLYAAYLAGLTSDTTTRQNTLHSGWGLFDADKQSFLPLQPPAALRDVVVAALRTSFTPASVGVVLRRQLADQALEILHGLIGAPEPAVRANVAALLGNLGTAAAYPSLRALQKDRSESVRQAAEQALGQLVYRPPYQLRIRTLGAFSVWRGDQEVRDREWRSNKARQLLQLLLTERGRSLPRDRVLEALWPEMEPDAAANNLRVTMNRLSKAIEPDRPDGAPPAYILQQGDTYGFNTTSDYRIDAADFADAVAEGQRAIHRGQRAAAVAAFRTAIGLYGGPYLPDNMYEDWTIVERERLGMLFNDAAIRLGQLLLDEGLAHDAIGLGWRVIEHDRAHEDAYRVLMRAHASLGERSTALRLYARCAAMLQEDLGVEPMPETTALYTTLREMR